MKRPCILTQMEMKDFPYYDYKSDKDNDGKKYIEVKKGQHIPQLDKYTS